jgi:hypothetical protein
MAGARHHNKRYAYIKNDTQHHTRRQTGVGRPSLRWLDDTEADIKTLDIKRWKLKAQNRKEWMAILRKAKAKLKGP